MKRSGKNVKKLYIIQLAIGFVLLLVLMVLLVVYKGGLTSYEPKEETVQFVLGNELVHDNTARFSTNNGIIEIKDHSGTNSVQPVPIIHKGNPGRKITLPENMVYTNPEFNTGYAKLNCFSTVELEEGIVTFKYDNKSGIVAGGFLYNGRDTYIFLEDVTLKVGANRIELPALSYIIADYRNSLEIYNGKTGEYSYYFLSGSDSVVDADNKYAVDIGRDVVILEYQENLIFSAIEGVDLMQLQ